MQRASDGLFVFGSLVAPVGLALLLAASLAPLEPGALSLGAFPAFHAAFTTFLAAATELSDLCVDAVELVVRTRRARRILAARPENGEDLVDPGRLSGRIALESLGFAYPGASCSRASSRNGPVPRGASRP